MNYIQVTVEILRTLPIGSKVKFNNFEAFFVGYDSIKEWVYVECKKSTIFGSTFSSESIELYNLQPDKTYWICSLQDILMEDNSVDVYSLIRKEIYESSR